MGVRTGLGVLAFLSMSLFVSSASAQEARGTIQGRVLDTTGGAIPGATVEVTSARRADTQKTVTNGEGNFVVLNLAPDTYKLKAPFSQPPR